jgi:hypothetical protein
MESIHSLTTIRTSWGKYSAVMAYQLGLLINFNSTLISHSPLLQKYLSIQVGCQAGINAIKSHGQLIILVRMLEKPSIISIKKIHLSIRNSLHIGKKLHRDLKETHIF